MIISMLDRILLTSRDGSLQSRVNPSSTYDAPPNSVVEHCYGCPALTPLVYDVMGIP